MPSRPRMFVASLGLAIFSLSLVVGAPPAFGQDLPGKALGLLQLRTSPFDPPTEDVFVADDGPGLDTGCTFNTDPNHPLVIDVLIDQAVGPVDANGYLANPGALVAQGVVPASVAVIMPAYDVDVNGSPPPESDEVVFNGQSLGTLTGDDSIWKLNSFTVGIDKIKFPAPAAGGAPAPVANRVQINVDTLSTGRWCTAIDWVALVIPIKLPVALKLEPTAGNRIAVRDYASPDTIDTIFEQSFDAACAETTDIGPYDDYPFSAPAGPAGSARLHATLERCPSNPQLSPEVRVDWQVAGSSLSGVETWSGYEGDVNVTMPGNVGVYDVALTFTVDGKALPQVHRKMFVTKATPLAQVDPPRLGWYERATSWAAGQSSEDSILSSLLGGLYSYGQGHWRYGYRFGGPLKCTWTDLVADPLTCDYADCHVFSQVFENMAATLGVGGLTLLVPQGTHNLGFLTSGAASLDPAFPGNAKPVGGGSYDRYFFANHSLRLKSSKYYDATFDGIYSSQNAFITANVNRSSLSLDADGPYLPTDEGWKIYPRGGSSVYDSWGRNDYKSPPGPIGQGAEGPQPAQTADIAFTGTAGYDLVDDDTDGLAEALRADVEVRLDVGGQYLVLAFLEKAGQPIANRPDWESMLPVEARLDEIAGTYDVTVQFSGEQIYRAGEDGPYDLVLYGLGDTGFTTVTLATPAYDRTLFGELPGHFTGVSEAAVDADGDGLYDYVEATLALDVRQTSELRLQGALGKDGQTLAEAGTVQTLDSGPAQVALRFDGAGLRRAGLDGPYEGSVNLIDADGATIDGLQFTTGPYSSDSFSALLVPQGPSSDQGIDTNGNGLYDLLRVDFGAEVGKAGSYLLTGVLRGAGSSSVVYADSQLVAPAGPTTIRLEFPGPVINALGLDGPYTVRVVVRDPATLETLDAVDLAQATGPYQAVDFDPFGSSGLPIVLTGVSNDFGVDTDGNGKYDLLHVDVEVALARTDFYSWSARLVDRDNTELGFYTGQATLPAGTTNIQFVFDGEAIGDNGVDGPYFVKGLLMYGRSGVNLVSVDVAETSAYAVSDFEGAADGVPPQIVVATEPVVLWPPSHKLETVAVSDFVLAVTDDQDPNVSPADVTIVAVTSDEPANALGDGSTGQDVAIAPDCRSVELRAERSGTGNGRVYTIHVAASDASGNVGTASFSVIVPHDSADGGAGDDGPAYTVAGSCGGGVS